jgi:hypothetical protein
VRGTGLFGPDLPTNLIFFGPESAETMDAGPAQSSKIREEEKTLPPEYPNRQKKKKKSITPI